MDPTLENLNSLIADIVCCEPAEILPLSLLADLGLDSLDLQQLILECEEQFEVTIPDEEASQVRTVAGLYDAILRAQDLTA